MLCWVSNIPSTFNIMNDITNNQIKAVQWQKNERNKIIRDYQFNYFGRWLLPQVFHKSSNFHFHFLTLRPLRQADEKQNYPGRDMACRVTSLIERTLLMSTLTKILTLLPISSGGGALSWIILLIVICRYVPANEFFKDTLTFRYCSGFRWTIWHDASSLWSSQSAFWSHLVKFFNYQFS